jgi:Tat protein translocase TatB subunit
MSFPHLAIIALIALVVLGPEKLPQVARIMGKAMAEFRRITGDFRSTVEVEMREMERTVALKEMKAELPKHVDEETHHQQEAITAAAAANIDPVLPPDTPPHAATHTTSSTSIEIGAPETEAAAASGKPSNGKPTPA